MKKHINYNVKTLLAGFVWLILGGSSCEEVEPTRSICDIRETERIDSISGISFELENDSLEEEVEDVYLDAKKWDEEDMGIDL